MKARTVTYGDVLSKIQLHYRTYLNPLVSRLPPCLFFNGKGGSHGLYVILLRLRSRARVGSLASVPWPEHTSPRYAQATELNCTYRGYSVSVPSNSSQRPQWRLPVLHLQDVPPRSAHTHTHMHTHTHTHTCMGNTLQLRVLSNIS